MAYKHSSLYLNPSEFRTHSSPRGILNPEPSDEPIFGGLQTSDTRYGGEKSYFHPHDMIGTEMNSSSLQASTQHSLNLKKSFFLNSPRRSIPTTPFGLSNKLKEPKDYSLSLRLHEKLKNLEVKSDIERQSEVLVMNPLVDIHDKNFQSFREPALENSMIMEGENDIAIPHLRWCAYCRAEVTTKFLYINTNKTFWSAVGIFLTGGIFGCFLIPYMTNTCKGARLICHKCNRILL